MSISEIQKKINPVVEEPNDDDDNEEIQDAPDVIELEDHEKFKDVNDIALNIETRGERTTDGILFKVSDVSKAFDMPNLQSHINDIKAKYTLNIDYKYFSCIATRNSCGKTSKKIKVETKMFLTHEGMLRVLFVSRNDKTKSFIRWVSNVVCVHQFGTKEQKQIMSSKLLGVDANAIKEVLNKDANTLPCNYLFSFGFVRDLRKSMNIDEKYDDNDVVYKFGFTKNLPIRTQQHQKEYGSIKNVTLRLKRYAYIDPQYMAQGETCIKDYVKTLNMKLEYKNYDELIVLPKKYEKQMEEKFTFVSQNYSGHNAELITKLKDKENEIIMLQKDIMMEQKNIEAEKQNTRLAEKDVAAEKQNTLLAEKEIKILRMEMRMQILENENIKK
jgi:hypothetical protein